MKLKSSKRVTAWALAQAHKNLGEARAAIDRVMLAKVLKPRPKWDNVPDSVYEESAFDVPSQHRLHRLHEQINQMALSLEAPFVAIAGRETPFCRMAEPSAWIDWLQQHRLDLVPESERRSVAPKSGNPSAF